MAARKALAGGRGLIDVRARSPRRVGSPEQAFPPVSTKQETHQARERVCSASPKGGGGLSVQVDRRSPLSTREEGPRRRSGVRPIRARLPQVSQRTSSAGLGGAAFECSGPTGRS